MHINPVQSETRSGTVKFDTISRMTPTSRCLLSHESASMAGEHLQPTLVDLIAISLQAKQAHWNITGCNFSELHVQFDQISGAALEAADEVAERMAAIGVSPDGRGVTMVNDSSLAAMPGGFLRDRQAVEVMAMSIEKACRMMRSRLEPLGNADPVSQDVLIGTLRNLEKHLWMLQARLCEPR